MFRTRLQRYFNAEMFCEFRNIPGDVSVTPWGWRGVLHICCFLAGASAEALLIDWAKFDRPCQQWTAAQIIAAGIMASTSGHAQTPNELLSQADRLAEQGNWAKAAPLYAKAEKEFQDAGDSRSELRARFGRLHWDAESGSYRATRDQVVRDMNDPLVAGDPQLKIQGLALLGNIDLKTWTTARGRRMTGENCWR